MPLPGLSADFNEPQSSDPTTAPPMQQQPQAPAQGLAQALARRKKKGLVTVKPPSALAAAISKARRAKQGGDRYG